MNGEADNYRMYVYMHLAFKELISLYIVPNMLATVDFFQLLSVAHLNGRTFQQYQSTSIYIMSSQRSYNI